MLQIFITYLVIYGLKSNLVVDNSSGVLIFQREKMYTSFRYISNLFLILGIIISASISYFLYTYIYVKFNMFYISETVNMLIVASYNIIVSNLLKKKKSFSNYLYDNSFSLAYDTVFMVSVLLTLDMNLSVVGFFLSLLAAVIVIFVINVLMGFFVKSFNRNYINISARNIAVRLFMMAIFSIILHYAAMLI